MLREPRKRGQRLHYHPHQLFGTDRPSVIGVEIVLDVQDATSDRKAIVYYEVAFNADAIVEEVLYRLRSEDEEAVFVRQGQDIALYGDLEDDSSLDAASKTVQPNRLFLETCFNAALVAMRAACWVLSSTGLNASPLVGRARATSSCLSRLPTMMHFVLPSGRG